MTTKYYTEEFTFTNGDTLEGYWYDKATGDLFIEFKSGTVAGYKDVPARVVYGLRTANSPGGFYHKVIRQEYKGQSGDVDIIRREETPVAATVEVPTTNPCVEARIFEIVYSATFTSSIQAISMEQALEELRKSAKGVVNDLTIKSVTLVG